MSTVLKIEPIDFEQNMMTEHGYQTNISNMGILENFEVWEKINIKNCFPKIF